MQIRNYAACVIRLCQPGDLEELVGLINRTDEADQTGFRPTPETFAAEYLSPRTRPHTFVATHEGRVIGYVLPAFTESPDFVNLYGYGTVDPAFRRQGVGTALFRRALEHLAEAARNETRPVTFHQAARLWIPGVEPLLRTVGLEPGNRLLNLRRPHLDGLAAPASPRGYRFRPASAADAAACAEAYNAAFAWSPNRAPRTAEEAADDFASPSFRADLHPVLLDPADRVVGFCHCSLNADRGGRIHTIALLPTEQGKGLGQALLWHCLHLLKAVGADRAALTVDAHNPTGALPLYERAGFLAWREMVWYKKRL